MKTWTVLGFDNTRLKRQVGDSDPFGHSIYGNARSPNLLIRDDWDGSNDTCYGKTDGWSLCTGIEVGRNWSRRFNQYCDLAWRPFVGFDYEQAIQAGFNEHGNSEFVLHYHRNSLHRALIRTGISATVNAYWFDLTGRVMYTGLLGGDTVPKSTVTLPLLVSDPLTVTGTDYGNDFVNVGFDVTCWLDERRSRFLVTTYEASLGNRLTAQTLTLAFVQRF